MKRLMRSIEGRLIIRVAALFGLAVLATVLILFLRYDGVNVTPSIGHIRAMAQSVARALERDPAGGWRLDAAAAAAIDFDYVVRAADGRVLLASGGGVVERLGTIDPRWQEGTVFTADEALGLVTVGGQMRARSVAGPLLVQVAETKSRFAVQSQRLLSELFDDVMPILLPFVIASLLIDIMSVRDSLRPLSTVARQASAIGPTATNVRLSEEQIPDELIPFVKAVNQALARLDDGFRLQREFTADAAHELRTPLAVLAAHLDSLADRQVAAALRQDVDRMARLVGQLLAVAQLEALQVSPDDTADLHAIAVDVAALLAPLAVRRQRDIAVIGAPGPVRVRGNADAIHQAIRNLAENALHHAPLHTAVDLEITREPAVHVIDRGPGVPAEQRERVLQRFWRADRGKGDGAGLGLAIVARIAAAHGGRLSIDNADGGGARFSLRLQPAG